MSVSKILEKKGKSVVFVGVSSLVKDALKLLSAHDIGVVIVCGAEKTVEGILSERDIVRAIMTSGVEIIEHNVALHMTKDVVTASPNTSILEVMGLMTNRKFRHIPIVNDGKLDGVVSIGDVVKYRLAELEHEKESLRSYITAG